MPEQAEVVLCSKCSREPATSKSPQWCKACRAKYQREYEDTKEDRAFRRGFQAGIDAQRSGYVDHWLWMPPDAMVTCAEVAKVLAQTPRPTYTPKVIDTVSEPIA